MHHNLLPIHLKNALRLASDTAQLDSVIRRIQEENPKYFHSENTLHKRVFFDEPRGAYSGRFINPAPKRI